MRGLILVALPLGLMACAREPQYDQAKRLIAQHCAACHQIPGIQEAHGNVGPSLAGIAHQQIIAGYLPNTPETLTRWIEHPQRVLPGNAMPEMRLTHAQSQSIAAYLYTLEKR
jgi:cytochrome c2